MERDDIKLGLGAVIAVTLIINTYFVATNDGGSGVDAPPPQVSTPAGGDSAAPGTATGPGAGAAAPGQANQVPQPQNPANNLQVQPNQPGQSAPPPTAAATQVKFQRTTHDYGTIKAGSNNPTAFKFTNTGDKPLIISNATGSCGCTVPEWPKEPIMPNQTSEIKVVVTPKENQAGQPFNKTVTITANIPGGQTTLNVKANVVP